MKRLACTLIVISIALSICQCEKEEKENEFSFNSGTFVDPRDGKKYKWVEIGDQVWMGGMSPAIMNGKNWLNI